MKANEARRAIAQLEELVANGTHRDIVIKRMFGQFEVTVFEKGGIDHEHHLSGSLVDAIDQAAHGTLSKVYGANS